MVGDAAHSVPFYGEGNLALYTFIFRKQQIGSYKVRICCLGDAVSSVPYLTKTDKILTYFLYSLILKTRK